MPPIKRKLPMDPASSVAEVAGLMGPLGIPGAIGGVLGKAAKLSPDDMAQIHELLGKPIKLGKRLLRLSSGDPQKNTAILHSATDGERMATPLDEFLRLWRTIGEETDDVFPAGAVLGQPGTRASAAKIGPKGGATPMKRKIPKTATR